MSPDLFLFLPGPRLWWPEADDCRDSWQYSIREALPADLQGHQLLVSLPYLWNNATQGQCQRPPPHYFFFFCLSAQMSLSVVYIDNNNPPPKKKKKKKTFSSLAQHQSILPPLTRHPAATPDVNCIRNSTFRFFVHISSFQKVTIPRTYFFKMIVKEIKRSITFY